MEKLVIEGSKDKPSITLDKDKGYLYIGGSSLPENVLDVYNPILEWIDQYLAEPNPDTKIEFYFEYLNTASSQMIMRIIEKCLELKSLCESLSITWYYTTGDLDMRDFGHELVELTNYPINVITREHHP
jgi:hypothetical protein